MAGRGGGRDERLRKQREYQRKYRKRVKGGRAPDRDEIARQLLHYAITENLKRDRETELWHMADSVIERLVERGYDLEASQNVFIKIVDRYEKGWSFQRRVHLLQPREGATGDEGDNRH
jgi:SOS response regulatory protein OraA/RecX